MKATVPQDTPLESDTRLPIRLLFLVNRRSDDGVMVWVPQMPLA